MLPWILCGVLLLLLIAVGWALLRAAKRLLEFDSIFQMIVEPMEEHSEVMKKIVSAEGLLHDHPEVLAFHKANVELIKKIEFAVISVRESRPPKQKNEELPRPEAV